MTNSTTTVERPIVDTENRESPLQNRDNAESTDRSDTEHDVLDSHRKQAVRLLKSLANEHRLAILCSLREGEVSVGELVKQLPLSQSALSQHLAWLRTENLVAPRRVAQTVYYRLNNDQAVRIIQVLNDLYCEQQHAATSAASGSDKA
jgi:DNA-binding transcriptional ArsR family regulator